VKKSTGMANGSAYEGMRSGHGHSRRRAPIIGSAWHRGWVNYCMPLKEDMIEDDISSLHRAETIREQTENEIELKNRNHARKIMGNGDRIVDGQTIRDLCWDGSVHGCVGRRPGSDRRYL
jgi:hypothetical protein